MLRPLLLGAIAALVLSVPLGQAQMSTTLTAVVGPAEEPLLEGGRLILQGTITYTADHFAMLNTNGIPVTYQVTSAPAWATVTVSPGSDVIPVQMMPGPYASWTAVRAFQVVLDGASEGVDGEVGLVEITATATPTAPQGRPSSTKTTIPVRFDAVEEPCDVVHDAALLPPADDIADDPQADEPVVVQSSAATPLAMPLAAVAGFGAVGAGVGVLLKRRLR